MRYLLAACALAFAFAAQPAEAQLFARRYVIPAQPTWSSTYLRYRVGRSTIYPNSNDSTKLLLYLMLAQSEQRPDLAAMASPDIDRQLALYLILNRQRSSGWTSRTDDDQLRRLLLTLLLRKLEKPCDPVQPSDPDPADI